MVKPIMQRIFKDPTVLLDLVALLFLAFDYIWRALRTFSILRRSDASTPLMR